MFVWTNHPAVAWLFCMPMRMHWCILVRQIGSKRARSRKSEKETQRWKRTNEWVSERLNVWIFVPTTTNAFCWHWRLFFHLLCNNFCYWCKQWPQTNKINNNKMLTRKRPNETNPWKRFQLWGYFHSPRNIQHADVLIYIFDECRTLNRQNKCWIWFRSQVCCGNRTNETKSERARERLSDQKKNNQIIECNKSYVISWKVQVDAFISNFSINCHIIGRAFEFFVVLSMFCPILSMTRFVVLWMSALDDVRAGVSWIGDARKEEERQRKKYIVE